MFYFWIQQKTRYDESFEVWISTESEQIQENTKMIEGITQMIGNGLTIS